MTQRYKRDFVLLYIAINNRSIRSKFKQFPGSQAHSNLITLFNKNTLFSDILWRYCIKPCYDCEMYCKLYKKTSINYICIVNAILNHVGLKSDIDL